MISGKRFFAFLNASLICLVFLLFPGSVQAEYNIDNVYEPYFIVVDADNPQTALDGLERDADLRIEPASTTKVLTCIVAIEETLKNGGSLSDMATVSANAVNFGRGNSLMGLEQGDSFSLLDLLYGMMLPSGNDAAIAIAEHVAGTTGKFADLMNAKAKEIGMNASHFVTVHGKHDSNHYSTVRDMAILTAYALENATFCEIVATPSYTTKSGNRELTVLNSNRLLVDMEPTEKLPNPISCLYPYAIGVKTGDTTQAGKCLIAAARKEGITLIAVLFGGTLNDPTYDSWASDGRKDKYNAYRFQDAKNLFEYEFNLMEKEVSLAELQSAGLQTDFPVKIPNAIDSDPNGGILIARADLPDSFSLRIMEPKVKAILESASSLAETSITNNYAPISDGTVIGKVSYVYNGETLFSTDLVATRSIKEGTAQIDVSSSDEAPQMHSGGLIAEVKTDDSEDHKENCGNLSTKQIILMILVPVILLLLIVCLVLFALYMRAEKKRKQRRKNRSKANYTKRQSR